MNRPDISEIRSRLKILLIASDSIVNKNFDPLYGVKRDIELIKSILFKSESSLFSGVKFEILNNPTSHEFRQKITEIIRSTSIDRDIFFLYYSGHGAILNGNQFGFICKDTEKYPRTHRIIPSTLITSNELIDSLSVAEIIPFFLIDACHSGLIQSNSLPISIDENFLSMRDRVHGVFASDFVLFAACAGDEWASGNSEGGFFSQQIAKIASIGDRSKEKKPILSVHDIYQSLVAKKNVHLIDGIEPRLFFGFGMSDFPLIKNKAYKPTIIRMDNYKLKILELLWNNGNPITFSSSELLARIGKGAYANNKKLTYSPWELASKKNKRIGLTDKGISFMRNEISIPDIILKDDTTNGEYITHPESSNKKYKDFRKDLPLLDLLDGENNAQND